MPSTNLKHLLYFLQQKQLSGKKMQKSFKINGMSCQHCVMAVKKELQKLNLKNLEVKIGEAVIEFDEELTSVENVIDAISEAGYEVVA